MRIDQRKFTAISTRGHEPVQEERLAGALHSTSVAQAALQARYNLTSCAKDERREAGMPETWILRTRNRLTSMQNSLSKYITQKSLTCESTSFHLSFPNGFHIASPLLHINSISPANQKTRRASLKQTLTQTRNKKSHTSENSDDKIPKAKTTDNFSPV